MDINENEEQSIDNMEPSSNETEVISDSEQEVSSTADQEEIAEAILETDVVETEQVDEADLTADPPADVIEEAEEQEFIKDLPVLEEDTPEDDPEDVEEEPTEVETAAEEQELMEDESVVEDIGSEQELATEETDKDSEGTDEDTEQADEDSETTDEDTDEEPLEDEPALEESDTDELLEELEEELSPESETEPTLESSPLAVPIKDDGRAWFVVHCYSGNEDKVRHNIMQRIESMGMDDLIFDVVVPTEDEVNIKNGERQTIEKKVFPGYILVNMILTEESWYMVRNTPGVTGFVGMGNDPTPLQPEEVARILKRMESESPRVNVTFRPGERVRIVDGPFEDFYGKVSEIDMERATVRVMVNFFGRETPVELDFLQVEEA